MRLLRNIPHATMPPPTGFRRVVRAQHAGFTLIELAVVVVVIALLLGSILVPLTSQVEQRKVLETQKTLDEVKEALIGFAMINGRLPRPATSFSDGTERGVCGTVPNCTGFIPWTTLGVPKTDSYGKIIRYSVTPAFADAAFTLSTAATKTVQTRATSSPYALINLATPVPAVIFSQGANNWGTSDNGSTLIDGSATNTDEDSNNNNDGTQPFVSRPSVSNTSATGGEFDDIVVWISPGVLFNRMVSAGKLP
jgi:prepilin-type N-terminal cleavage/methylation domain-containing protein